MENNKKKWKKLVQKDNNVTSQNPDYQERLRQWLGTNTSSHRLPLSEFSKSQTVGNVSSKYRLNSFRWGPQTSVSDSGPPLRHVSGFQRPYFSGDVAQEAGRGCKAGENRDKSYWHPSAASLSWHSHQCMKMWIFLRYHPFIFGSNIFLTQLFLIILNF